MKRIALIAGPLSIAFFILAPVSGVSAAGDPLRGKQLAVQCFACHGVDGNSPSPVNPKIGGQHEQYLLLALKAYVDGARPNSLMSGAVLDKSEQDLEDLAAYFAAQKSVTGKGPADGRAGGPKKPDQKKPGQPRGPGGPGGLAMAMRFNHGERDSDFMSMLARAQDFDRLRLQELSAGLCQSDDENMSAEQDRDNDGLADRYDAAPDDAGEFVADRNGDGYYEICNIRQLAAIAMPEPVAASATTLTFDARRARSYQLVRDLDAAGIAFEPIGNCGPTGNCMRAMGQFGYNGVFDGRGHVISNLKIDVPERGGVGLFGVLGSSGIVMHLKLENAEVTGRAGVGAIVGSNFGTLYHCEASGQTNGMMAIGGLVGGSGGLVYGSYFSGRVEAKQAAGGLVGDMTGAVYNSAADTAVSGNRGIGGLVGLNTFGSILDSYATGAVKGVNDVGGLVGVNTDARVRNSYAAGPVQGESNNIGGLVGFNSQSIIRNGYATGDVSGADAVGGLVGRSKGIVANGYATGLVSGAGQTGPVVGIVVEGDVSGTYDAASSNLGALTGKATGWSPGQLPVARSMAYFCDRNGNGFIDPGERSANNYIWNFGGPEDQPEISCISGRPF